MASSPLASAQTFLFVPGDRPERFQKAVRSGADQIVIDLEDAVGTDAKEVARLHLHRWLRDGGRAVVRVNRAGSPWLAEDVSAAAGGLAVMVPKVESARDVAAVQSLSGPTLPVIALIESARGMAALEQICRAPGLVRLAFGNVDFAASIGVDPASHLALVTARSMLVYASAAAGCPPPIDGVTTAISDRELLETDTSHARDLGFGARLCIHPDQVEVVARGMSPTQQETAWAREVLASSTASVRSHRGQMIDAPVLVRARRLLARAGIPHPPPPDPPR